MQEEKVIWYGQIEITNPETKERENLNIYGMTNEDNKIEFYAEDELLATLSEEENEITIVHKYQNVITPEIFLAKMNELKQRGQEPVILDKLEKMREQRQKNRQRTTQKDKEKAIGASRKKQNKKEDEEKSKDNKDKKERKDTDKDSEQKNEKQTTNKHDIEIRMNSYITADKKIADIIPEIKQKKCKRVMIRSNNNINFELYGIDKDGKEIELTSLKQTEGKNPTQKIIATNLDGSKVQETRVNTMLKIQPGTNEQKGNDTLGIKIGNLGIEQVYYCRRDQSDNYLAVPVGLKTTNDKYTTREVRELASKKHNPTIGDDIQRAKQHLESEDDKTIIENIDDTPQNDKIEPEEAKLIKEAAKRCNMSVESFMQEYEKQNGDTISERIENTEEEINEQFRGRNTRRQKQ